MLNSQKFETWSQFWISITTDYSKASLVNPQPVEEFVSLEKKRVAKLVFEHIKPICINFLNVVVGKTQLTYAQEISQGVCINRLLGKIPLHLLPQHSSKTISQYLQETFYLGVFTHLYFMTFPTRELYEKVDIILLQQKWEIDAIAADHVMGYYGDPKNPMCMELWEYHFNTKVIKKLKNLIKIGFFGAGKYQSFFRNIYLAGALLVLSYDLATSEAVKKKDKKEELIKRIPNLMNPFIEASMLEYEIKSNSTEGLNFLLFIFGALDALCQKLDIDTKITINIFESLLKNELGEYSADEAKNLIQVVIKASDTPEGKLVMEKRGNSLNFFMEGV